MAVILTVTMIEVAKSPDALRWTLLLSVPLQLVVGTLVGVLLGYVGLRLIRGVRVPTVGLYPALTLALAFLSFSAATMLEGSGLMSVYFTALVLGNSRLPYKSGLLKVHESLAWLSQIALFLMSGLLVFPSQLLPVAIRQVTRWLGLAMPERPSPDAVLEINSVHPLNAEIVN
jgi:cell volume regulation protein A